MDGYDLNIKMGSYSTSVYQSKSGGDEYKVENPIHAYQTSDSGGGCGVMSAPTRRICP